MLLFCYLSPPWPSLSHYQGDNLTNPILITFVCVSYQPKAHQETLNEVELLRLAKRLMEIELGSF